MLAGGKDEAGVDATRAKCNGDLDRVQLRCAGADDEGGSAGWEHEELYLCGEHAAGDGRSREVEEVHNGRVREPDTGAGAGSGESDDGELLYDLWLRCVEPPDAGDDAAADCARGSNADTHVQLR